VIVSIKWGTGEGERRKRYNEERGIVVMRSRGGG
jgi:hypothetical protein